MVIDWNGPISMGENDGVHSKNKLVKLTQKYGLKHLQLR